jgi:flagellin
MKGINMFSITTGANGSSIAYQLNQNGKNLRKSLERLSTMKRINSSGDDPGGLGVSMKFNASIRRTEAVLTQVNSTESFLQTQDGVLQVASDVLARMSELAQYGTSTTISSSDRNLYSTEFVNLQQELNGYLTETYNGISLFRDSGTVTPSNSNSAATISITGQTVGISTLDFGSVNNRISINVINITSSAASTAALTSISSAIDNLASLEATNGSQQSVVSFASDLLETNQLNLEAAYSSIVDVDYAAEMVRYTSYSVIQDQNLALLAQANSRAEKILRLLE